VLDHAKRLRERAIEGALGLPVVEAFNPARPHPWTTLQETLMTRSLSLSCASILTLALASGCFTSNAVSPDVVKTKAASDFSCTAVTVDQVASTSWKASGCGQAATYTCWTSVGMGSGTCVREGTVPAP
jgi:hypothetical protein